MINFPVDKAIPSIRDLNRLFDKVVSAISERHCVFNALASAGFPVWDTSIKTAYVSWDPKSERIEFHWSPQHFINCSYEQRQFVLCHEMFHVLNKHMKRMDIKQRNKWNRAMDVVVNEGLVKNFGFKRKNIDPKGEACWLDTVFKGKSGINPGQAVEYYAGHIPNDPAGPEGIDDHKWESFDEEAMKAIIDQVRHEVDNKSIKDFIKNSPAGTQQGLHEIFMPNSRFSVNKKWETVIKKWERESSRMTSTKTLWTERSRLASALDKRIILPTDKTVNVGKGKIEILFFLDTSGSCSHLAQRFFAASQTLDPERFKVTLCAFNTEAYRVVNGKLIDGGTSFNAIEVFIQHEIKAGRIRKYPTCFIITDGYGDHVKPQEPEKWHWFLSTDYRSYIPKESSVYMLSDYE